MKIDAKKIQDLIMESSNVIIMAHKSLDLDALGASLGIYYLCKELNKSAYLLIEDETHEKGVLRSLNQLEFHDVKVEIKKLNEIKDFINKKTLLFILDVHISKLLQNKKILDFVSKIILLDHHIIDNDCIKKNTYQYIEEAQSSTSEIVLELVEKLNTYIPPYVATIMLAGMAIDTNNFLTKTNALTHNAAAFLHQAGANMQELYYLLKEDLGKYIQRQKIIESISIFDHKFAIGIGEENIIYRQEDLAKEADAMLLFDEIEAAFTIGKISDNIVGISARSLGNVDVQKMMEQLKGGGHQTDAATQLTNTSIKESKKQLLDIIHKI